MKSMLASRTVFPCLLLALGVLGFWYAALHAAPQTAQPPFANAVEQRNETIRELREIKELLKEQNALLKASQKSNGQPPKR